MPGRAARGGTCRRASGTGRPSITGIAAGHWMEPGKRPWTGCGPGVMRPRARTGRSAPTRRSPGPISTRPGPAMHRLLMTAQGAPANDKKSGREAIGRSRGGLTTKIHLTADLRCRPVARLTSPGQHGDSPRFIPLMDAVRIQRRGLGRPRSRPGRAMADKAYSSRRQPRLPAAAPHQGGYPRQGRPESPPPQPRPLRRPGRRSLTTGGTRSATPSNAASASSSSSAPWPPATTSASASTKAPSTSPRSASGYATPSP